MKKNLSIILSIVLVICSFTYLYADTKNEEKQYNDLIKEYSEMVSFYSEVENLFPEATIGEIPSFTEFSVSKECEDYCESFNITESFAKTIDGILYTLNVFENGSFEMISLTRDSIFTGISDYIDGSQKQMRWRYTCLRSYHEVDVNLYIYYNYLTEQYYFGTPNGVYDLPTVMGIEIISLYRSGSDNNVVTFLGNPFELMYDPYEMVYHFGLRLWATLNVDNGVDVAVYHTYEEAY